MEPQNKKRFLFLHSDNPTQRRSRSRSLDARVRRHLMVDIGRSRRKPSKPYPFVTLEWQSNNRQGQDSTNREIRNDQVAQAPAEGLMAPCYTSALYTTPPILHVLSVFEKEWGEDRFSAYGFALIKVAGENALSSRKNAPRPHVFHMPRLNDTACSSNTFWFPFAFRQSAFLHHYQKIFTSPNVLVPLYRRSGKELTTLALERSLETIQCVESTLASSDMSKATSERVISTVLALVCYNVSSWYGRRGLERAAEALSQVYQLGL